MPDADMKPLRSSYPKGHLCNPDTPWRHGADVAGAIDRERRRIAAAGIPTTVVRVQHKYITDCKETK